MFEFWGGVPELVIPDNEKAAVREASRYEPDLNPTYQELATHYGTTVLPARPRAPRDKAKVESFFATLECELLDRSRFPTPADARREVFGFIEGFYNTRRIHSALGYASPANFERLNHAA